MKTHEQAIAVREAEELTASNAYFEARPELDTLTARRLFEAGFVRGWHACIDTKLEPVRDDVRQAFKQNEVVAMADHYLKSTAPPLQLRGACAAWLTAWASDLPADASTRADARTIMAAALGMRAEDVTCEGVDLVPLCKRYLTGGLADDIAERIKQTAITRRNVVEAKAATPAALVQACHVWLSAHEPIVAKRCHSQFKARNVMSEILGLMPRATESFSALCHEYLAASDAQRPEIEARMRQAEGIPTNAQQV